ncbi:hypothetical protein BGHDH14_bgh02393 [Blumeria hordei DH14]|uniref:Acid phosphatase-like protein n=1 Tax=Blumeria graminis f. sp. hordei (strain DH14) TaxID=546991 RepID=N1JR18_BLUG1|nr:hypothetical protein BGHDH14_bgh02393 [Blumeria hordei DH14]
MAQVTGLGAFFIIIFIIVLGCTGWIIYTHVQARRLGLPQPTLSSHLPFRNQSSSPGSGGFGEKVVGWVQDKVHVFRRRKTQAGAEGYAEPLSRSGRGGVNNRGFGPLDPDDAWDTRVGTEADLYGPSGYHEEHELNAHFTSGSPPGYEEGRRSDFIGASDVFIRASDAGLDRRFNDDIAPSPDPFSDSAKLSDINLGDNSPPARSRA